MYIHKDPPKKCHELLTIFVVWPPIFMFTKEFPKKIQRKIGHRTLFFRIFILDSTHPEAAFCGTAVGKLRKIRGIDKGE